MENWCVPWTRSIAGSLCSSHAPTLSLDARSIVRQVSECISQLKRLFVPEPRLIKKQVESLIDREYLERDVDFVNNQTYKYMA